MALKILIPIGFLMLLIMSVETEAHERIRLGFTSLGTNNSGEVKQPSMYERFLSEMSDIDVVSYPPGRVMVMLQNAEIDCLFPGSLFTFPDPGRYIQSKPLREVTAYIFTIKKYQSLQDLAGKKIAITRGFAYGNVRDKINAEFLELISEEAKFDFLKLGRVDGFVSYQEDISLVIPETDLNRLFRLGDASIYKANEAFLCHDTPRLGAFVDKVNERISQRAK